MSEQTVLLPDIRYYLEKILEEVAKAGVTELEFAVGIAVDNKLYTLWLKVRQE